MNSPCLVYTVRTCAIRPQEVRLTIYHRQWRRGTEGALASVNRTEGTSPFCHHPPTLILRQHYRDLRRRDRPRRLIIYKMNSTKEPQPDPVGTRVAKIAPGEKAVLDIQGNAILRPASAAPGADPACAIEGAELNGVFTLRGIEDADRSGVRRYGETRRVWAADFSSSESSHSLAKLVSP